MPKKVRLTRKLSQVINGIDLSRARTGDQLELSTREAELLIAEGWAAPVSKADDQKAQAARRRRKATR